ncbi:unnamed protein product [Cochlearia groenlandica]
MSSSSSLSHQFPLFITSFFFLLLLLSAGAFTPAATPKATTTPRTINRARNQQQSTEFLQSHNAARESSGASNLKWDQGLARFASKWAKQRKTDCKMAHSSGPYGENMFWYQRNENWSPKRVVAKWMEESLNYDRITNTCQSGKMCGHYTQIVWRATTAVGCARAKCDSGRGFLVVCEYSPSGNYEGESPFDLPN